MRKILIILGSLFLFSCSMTVEDVIGATVATIDMNRKDPSVNINKTDSNINGDFYACDGVNKVHKTEKTERIEERSADGKTVKIHERTEIVTKTKGVSIGGGINRKNKVTKNHNKIHSDKFEKQNNGFCE